MSERKHLYGVWIITNKDDSEMRETREEFISRMLWMVQKIDESDFKSLDILNMLNYQLKQREIECIKRNRDLIVNFISTSLKGRSNTIISRQITSMISAKVETEFNNLIRKEK